MKTKKTILIAIVILIATTGLHAADYVPGELIVKLEHGILDPQGFEQTPISHVPIRQPQLAAALQEGGVRSVERVFKNIFATPPFRFTTKRGKQVQFKDLSQVYLLKMDESLDMELVAERVQNLPGVIYAHPNHYMYAATIPPNDYDFDSQWGLDNTSEGNKEWDVNALKAWSVEAGDPDVLIAIIDMGLEPHHYDEASDEFYEDDRIEAFWDGSLGNRDAGGHGTHVAGIAAATNGNGTGEGGEHGVAGVAGGWNGQGGVKLLIAKGMYDSGKVKRSTIAPAIEWATQQGADVLNGSFGGWPGWWHQQHNYHDEVREAIEQAFWTDMALFFSTGNNNTDRILFPSSLAGYDYCCAVGNIDSTGQRYSHPEKGSNYGPKLSFMAPGTNIYSTTCELNDYYISFTGTSMASPMAAGAAALLYSDALDVNVELLDVDCKRILEHTARDIKEPPSSPGWDKYTGYGCVDAWEALRHFYWPYDFGHDVVPFQYIQVENQGSQQVNFMDKPNDTWPAGRYICNKYRLTVSEQYGQTYEELPWVWGRLEDAGYDGSNPNIARFWVDVNNQTTSGSRFITYVYELTYNLELGQSITYDKWAPRDTSDIQINYTALGRTATKTTHSPSISSSNYGFDSDVAVDFVHPDVPNTVHISYYDLANGDLRYVIDNFNGFSSSEIVDSDGDVGAFSSIALDYEGKPHIAYYDDTENIPKHARKSLSGWIIEPMRFEDQQGIFDVRYTSIAISEVPGLAVGLVQACGYLYYANPIPAPFEGHDLVYFRRDGSGPYGWSGEAVDIGGDVGDYCCIAVGPDGTPHISYYDVTNTNLKYAVRVGTNDWVTMTVDDDIGNVGKYTSIAVDKLGGVHISYYDQTNDALKYAYRSSGGGSWQIETAYEYLGKGTSICIDDDGLPVIVFGSSSTIGCAKRLTSGWDIQPVDGSGNAHYGTSVGIDNLGRVVATYYKDNRLYVARRMRWEQNPGGNMAASCAGVGEELKPSNPMEPDITEITPNPTTGSATIHYQLPYATDIRIAIYDVSGQKVTTLVSGEQSAGMHELVWRGHDNVGRQVSSGVYFIRMETENHQVRKKITLLR